MSGSGRSRGDPALRFTSQDRQLCVNIAADVITLGMETIDGRYSRIVRTPLVLARLRAVLAAYLRDGHAEWEPLFLDDTSPTLSGQMTMAFRAWGPKLIAVGIFHPHLGSAQVSLDEHDIESVIRRLAPLDHPG